MAVNLKTAPLLRALQARTFSSARLVPVGGVSDYDVKTTVLPNNIVTVAADNDAAITRVAVIFKAGSRFESLENSGTVHVLRLAAGLSTRNASQFAIARKIQQVGASLSCTVDREVVAYTLEGTREAVSEVLPLLREVASHQEFRPWEVSDQTPRARLELATRPPQLRAIDLLHKAAYRRGLGNSLYSSKHQIGKINNETLQHYVAQNFLTGRCAVAGLGIDAQHLGQFAQSLELPTGDGTSEASPYKGGEIRSDKGGNLAFVALGVEGGNNKEIKNALTYGVLKKVLGTGSSLRPWGTNSGGILSKATGGDQAIAAFSVTYSDSGLFGALIAAEAKDAGRVVETAYKTLKSINVSEADVTRGKNQLKRSLLCVMEKGSDAVNKLGVGALHRREAFTGSDLVKIIDSISSSDVKAAASKIGSGKLSIAGVGNLRNVPFLDELK